LFKTLIDGAGIKGDFMSEQTNYFSILVADDDEGDRFLINKAMKANNIEGPVKFFGDGQKLIDHLKESLDAPGPGHKPPLPSLVLLDLNMPELDGRDTLKIIKGDAELKSIPVIILSNSANPEDVMGCYKGGANSLFVKPLDYLELVRFMGMLKTYWLQNAQLPFERPRTAE
jgi:CheY-like chemotaxis protein